MAKKKPSSSYIPGIYNYCDRWCERCTFTSRCRNYEGEDDLSPEEKDIHNEAFWKKISKNFADAVAMIKREALKSGINLDNIPEEESKAWEKKEEESREAANNHPVAQLTWRYVDKAKAILADKAQFTEIGTDLTRMYEMGIRSEESLREEAALVLDCQDIIYWYLHFIHVKFMRALMGQLEDDGWEEENGYPKDSDGSAKIALIGIDRSIEAWTTLLRFLPQSEDAILEILALLEKSRRLGEEQFPQARQFVRPGFDEQ